MSKEALLKKAEEHALPLVKADPLLFSIAQSRLKEKAANKPVFSNYTQKDFGSVIIEYYIDQLASKQRISEKSAQKEDPQAFSNLLKLSGLSEEECNQLIQSRVQQWDDHIEM